MNDLLVHATPRLRVKIRDKVHESYLDDAINQALLKMSKMITNYDPDIAMPIAFLIHLTTYAVRTATYYRYDRGVSACSESLNRPDMTTDSLSLDHIARDDGEPMSSLIGDPKALDPSQRLETQEVLRSLADGLKDHLSDLELRVALCFAHGLQMKDIARLLMRDDKSLTYDKAWKRVDCAIQRVRMKKDRILG